MASRIWDLIRGLGKDRILLTGKFFPNGTNNPSSTVGAGFNAVTRAGVGLFDVQLQDGYPDLLHADAFLYESSLTNKRVKPVSYTPATRTLRLVAWDPSANAGAGGAVDLTANAATFISFQLTMSNTSIVLGG